MRVSIRRALLRDAALLAELAADMQAVHIAAEPHIYRETTRGDVEAWFHEKLHLPDVTVLIAEAGEPLGYLMAVHMRQPHNPFSYERTRVFIDQISVRQLERSRGVGRLLVQSARELAAELGCPRLQLDVRAVNARALRFYEQLGFQPVQLRLELPLDSGAHARAQSTE